LVQALFNGLPAGCGTRPARDGDWWYVDQGVNEVARDGPVGTDPREAGDADEHAATRRRERGSRTETSRRIHPVWRSRARASPVRSGR
jgi:hypothetical protein